MTKLGAPAFGHAAHRKFAPVIRRAVRRTVDGGRRSQIDDVAALALDEVPGRLSAHQHRAGDVGLKHRVELCAVHLDQRPAKTEAGAVHQHVEMSELLQHLAIRALHIVFVADVGLNGKRVDALGRLRQAFFVAACDGHTRAGSGQRSRNRKADAARTAGN